MREYRKGNRLRKVDVCVIVLYLLPWFVSGKPVDQLRHSIFPTNKEDWKFTAVG